MLLYQSLLVTECLVRGRPWHKTGGHAIPTADDWWARSQLHVLHIENCENAVADTEAKVRPNWVEEEYLNARASVHDRQICKGPSAFGTCAVAMPRVHHCCAGKLMFKRV